MIVVRGECRATSRRVATEWLPQCSLQNSAVAARE
jgi:hypothetical protein